MSERKNGIGRRSFLERRRSACAGAIVRRERLGGPGCSGAPVHPGGHCNGGGAAKAWDARVSAIGIASRI
jgi:hypothetical protein